MVCGQVNSYHRIERRFVDPEEETPLSFKRYLPVQIKVVPICAVNTHAGSTGIAICHLKLGARWNWVFKTLHDSFIPGVRWRGDWVGPSIGLDLLKKRNISLLLYMSSHGLKISEDQTLQQHSCGNLKPRDCAVGKTQCLNNNNNDNFAVLLVMNCRAFNA